jgi:hypothetical protein
MLAAGLVCACAEEELQVGTYAKGQVVEVGALEPVTVSEHASQADALSSAQRQAVEELFDLFLSSTARAGGRDALERNVLSHAADFIPRYKTVSSQISGGVLSQRLHLLVSYEKLGKDLDELGLIRPEGVAGMPRVLLSVKESGPGAGVGAGTASQAMRRALIERGYAAVDFSDHASSDSQKSGSESVARAEARRLLTQVLVTGSAQAAAAPDARLKGYSSYRARVAVKAVTVPGSEIIVEFIQEAEAVDVSSAGAAAKSLADAGVVAAGRLREALSLRYRERTEMSVLFLGLGGLDRARRLIFALRAQPGVIAAALDSVSGRDVKVRVFVESNSADELAANLMKLKGYSLNVRMVEPDYHYLEMEASSSAF